MQYIPPTLLYINDVQAILTYYSLPSPITFKHLSYRELNYY